MRNLADKTDISKNSRLGNGLNILAGALLIALVVPAMQWLDRGMIANNLETGVPNPLGIGVIAGFVLINALFYVVARRRLVPKSAMVLLYVMMSVALPFCSVGVISPLFGSIQATAREIYHREEPGAMKHIYDWQNADFFPKMEDEKFEYFMALRNPDFVEQQGIIDPKAESRNAVMPMRQFWDGMYASPELKKEYLNTELGFLDRLKMGWGDVPWKIWRPVLIAWAVFLGLITAGTMFLAQILYRDWTERENLPFPVAQLPLALLEEAEDEGGESKPSIFTNPFFLAGLGISVLLLALTGIAHYQIVSLPLGGAVTFQRVDFNQIFVREPFSFIKNNYLFLSPLLVGIALMIHQDILRGTLWIFFGLQILRLVTGIFEPSLSESLGSAWHGNKMPYYPELGTGAVLVFASVLLWRSRSAFVLFRRRHHDKFYDRDSYLSPRTAGIGLLVVVLAIGFFLYRMGAQGGGGVFVVIMVIVWTFIAAIALSRARTEGGLAATGTTLVNNRVLDPGIGYAAHTAPANVKALASCEWLTVSTVPGLLAAQIEGLYLACRLKVKARTIAVAVAVAVAVSVAVGFLSYMALSYWTGALNNDQRFFSGMVVCMWQMGGDLVYRQASIDWLWAGVIAVGALAMAALLILRKRYPKFPLPPICLLIVCLGTVVFQTGQDNLHPTYTAGPYVCFIWGPMLVAFVIKKLLLRFGGMDLYVRSLPAALGLIFGQVVMVVFWNLYHLVVQPANIGVFSAIFY